MATYADMEGFSYGELSRLTYEQVQSLTSAFWSYLRELTPEQRLELLEGFRSRKFPPPLALAHGTNYTKVESTALFLHSKEGPDKHSVDWATWIIALATVLNLMVNYSDSQKPEQVPPPQPPPTVIVINELPANMQPSPQRGSTESRDHER